jgi:hypothetical protein
MMERQKIEDDHRLGLTTRQIDKVLSRSSLTAKTYIGCYPADRIPLISDRYPHHMVINMDPSGFGGSHWCAVFVCSPQLVDYYDSLGDWPPPSEHIRQFLARFPVVRYTMRQWQTDRSAACGKHAIYFVHRRCAGVSFKQMLEHFARSKVKADRIVCAYFRTKVFDVDH